MHMVSKINRLVALAVLHAHAHVSLSVPSSMLTYCYARAHHEVNLFKHNPTISVINTPECGTHNITSIRTYYSQRTKHKCIYPKKTYVTILSQNFAFSVPCNPRKLGRTSSNLDPRL